jgi:hypothetical protein
MPQQEGALMISKTKIAAIAIALGVASCGQEQEEGLFADSEAEPYISFKGVISDLDEAPGPERHALSLPCKFSPTPYSATNLPTSRSEMRFIPFGDWMTCGTEPWSDYTGVILWNPSATHWAFVHIQVGWTGEDFALAPHEIIGIYRQWAAVHATVTPVAVQGIYSVFWNP